MLEENNRQSLYEYMSHWFSVFATLLTCLIVFPIALTGVVIIYVGKMLIVLGLLLTFDFKGIEEFIKSIWNINNIKNNKEL